MNMDWQNYVGQTLSIIMHENYGLTLDPKTDRTIYEIVFKAGRLKSVFDDGLLLEDVREEQNVLIYIPYQSIKCAEIFNL
jgi:hypothetical protein